MSATSAILSVGSALQPILSQIQLLDSLSVYRNAFSDLALKFAALAALPSPTSFAIGDVFKAAQQFNYAANFATQQTENLSGLNVKLSSNSLQLMKPLEISDHLADFAEVASGLKFEGEGPKIIRLQKELAEAKRREKKLERRIKELEEAQRVKPVDENEPMFG